MTSKSTFGNRVLLVGALMLLTACGTTTQTTVDHTLDQSANTAYMQGDWQMAESYYTKLTKVSPENSQAWLRMGNMRLRQNNVLGAVDAYQAAADKQDADAKSHYNLGTSYILLARESLLKARETLPEQDVGQLVIDAKLAQLDALMNGQVAGVTMPESGVFR